MKNSNLYLLRDVLSEEILPNFESRMLAVTLRAARQRKRNRRVAGALTGLACLILCLGSLWTMSTKVKHSKLTIVHSQAITTATLVKTQPNAIDFVRTKSFASVISSKQSERAYTIIGDEELLALVPIGSAGLIFANQTSNRAELVFFNPEDSKKFFSRHQ